MSRVLIVGAGAAGMIAGIAAARDGHAVTIIEKNEKCGKKLYITGKGRCNLTNAGDKEDIMQSVVTNPKFLYSAFSRFSNYDCIGFFGELGLEMKVERGNRVFPESDRAADVIDCLRKELKRLTVQMLYHTAAVRIDVENGRCTGIHVKCGNMEKVMRADVYIIATGGCSYPATGSTGDGYLFARQAGLKVTQRFPALVPINVREEWVKQLQGLSLKNITASVYEGEKVIFSEFGEMMFTHFGVTGPIVLSASSYIAKRISKTKLTMALDMKPALTEEQLNERILRDFQENRNKNFHNALDKLLPKKLIPVVVELSGIAPFKKAGEVTVQERAGLVKLLKEFRFTLTGLRGFQEAIITQGGIDVKELHPSTMQAKSVGNLRFAGEVLDVDAVTGGFNLQIAWSTGYAAGSSISDAG